MHSSAVAKHTYTDDGQTLSRASWHALENQRFLFCVGREIINYVKNEIIVKYIYSTRIFRLSHKIYNKTKILEENL
jgi:hypothetical protein